MSTLRVGVIGAGVMGRGHAEFIRDFIPRAQVVAVADFELSRAIALVNDINSVEIITFLSSFFF